MSNLCSGHLGNGLAIWYKDTHTLVAHIDSYRNIKYILPNERLSAEEIVYIEILASVDDRCVSITQDEKVFKERPIMNLYRELTEQEEVEFRQWARDNFNPLTDTVDSLWHPIVRDECNKIINEQINKL